MREYFKEYHTSPSHMLILIRENEMLIMNVLMQGYILFSSTGGLRYTTSRTWIQVLSLVHRTRTAGINLRLCPIRLDVSPWNILQVHRNDASFFAHR